MKRILMAAAAALIAGSGLAGAAVAQPYGHDRGPGWQHDHGRHNGWRKGDRIGRDEWVRYQRVDWRRHHLHRPPRGYEWRQSDDGNYVLAAVATGLIASIIANSR